MFGVNSAFHFIRRKSPLAAAGAGVRVGLAGAVLLGAHVLGVAQSTTPNRDPNAMTAGTLGPARVDPRADASAAYTEARAECRGVDRGVKRDCVRAAEGDWARSQQDKAPKLPPTYVSPAGPIPSSPAAYK